MSAVLLHSPADVLRWTLVALGVATDPTLTTLLAWPAYAADEPDKPDDCVTVYDTTPVTDGFTGDGEGLFHRGFQVRIRSSSAAAGAAKAEAVVKALNESVAWRTVTVGGTGYNVAAVSCNAPQPLGKDSPNTRRKVFVINGTVALTRFDDL